MAISWNTGLNDMITLLASLYPSPDRVQLVLRRAGLDPADIDVAGPPKAVWLRVVEEANRRDAITELLRIGKADYPNVDFDMLHSLLGQPGAPRAPELRSWHRESNDPTQLERITGQQPTFLPVSFLAVGLLRARSIARIASPAGLGTGFLTHRNLLVTNNHVIRDHTDARGSRVWFNYQKDPYGTDAEVVELALDPGQFFETSPLVDGDDWTVVRVKGDPNRDWGALPLNDVAVRVNDFVNIIQHPGGMPKQIALYHNVVAYADDRRVQYLTDTMPGSSGSPVFDSQWQLVAIHHSGGWLIEPTTSKVYFRNEGISVRALREGLAKKGLLPEA